MNGVTTGYHTRQAGVELCKAQFKLGLAKQAVDRQPARCKLNRQLGGDWGLHFDQEINYLELLPQQLMLAQRELGL